MEKSNEQLIHKINNFNSLSNEVKRYELQEILFKKIAWFFMYVLSFMFLFTVVGFWYFKSKSIDYERKSETSRKARLNLTQLVGFEEKYIKEVATEVHDKYLKIKMSLNVLCGKVRENPKKYTEIENKILFFTDKFNSDKELGRLKPYDEVLFYLSVNSLYEQIKFN